MWFTGRTPAQQQQTSQQCKIYAHEETDVDIWQQFVMVGKPASTKLTEGMNKIKSHTGLIFFMCSSLIWKTCQVNFPKEDKQDHQAPLHAQIGFKLV